jgi:alpha 1,3-glucosidase
MHSQYLYGLPERADNFLLKTTENDNPYRLYNLDIFQHEPYNKQNLYGSVPYLTAHSNEFDTAIAWMNSAETFVDILNGNE